MRPRARLQHLAHVMLAERRRDADAVADRAYRGGRETAHAHADRLWRDLRRQHCAQAPCSDPIPSPKDLLSTNGHKNFFHNRLCNLRHK